MSTALAAVLAAIEVFEFVDLAAAQQPRWLCVQLVPLRLSDPRGDLLSDAHRVQRGPADMRYAIPYPLGSTTFG